MSVSKIMKNILKLHPHTIYFVQELQNNDPDRLLMFFETVMQRVDMDPNSYGNSNHQHFKYRSDVNP